MWREVWQYVRYEMHDENTEYSVPVQKYYAVLAVWATGTRYTGWTQSPTLIENT